MSEKITSGIDLVEVERFRQLKPEIQKRFYLRVFTPAELEYIGGSFERAAGMFAAKEAVVKALGCGIGPVSWQDMEISHNADGNPLVCLRNEADKIAANMGIEQWSISISHTRQHATAIAIALIKEMNS